MRTWWWVWALAAGCPADGEGTDSGATPEPLTLEERVAVIVALTPSAAAGEQTFLQVCAYCHGADGSGSGTKYPALTERIPLLTREQVVTTIIEGKGNMDSYRFMPDQEIADVAEYVISSFGDGA